MTKKDIPILSNISELETNPYHPPLQQILCEVDLPDTLTRETVTNQFYGTPSGNYLKITPTTLYPYKKEDYVVEEGGLEAYWVSQRKIVSVEEIPAGVDICVVERVYQYPSTDADTTLTPICFDYFKKETPQHSLNVLALWNKRIVSLPIKYINSIFKLQDSNYRLEGILENIDISAELCENCKGF